MINSILHTKEEVVDWFKLAPDILSFDTETTSLSYIELELVGMSFCDGRRACYIDFYNMDQECRVWILNYISIIILELKLLIMHNAPFDLKVLHKIGIEPTPNIFCSMTAAHLLNETGPKSLKVLANIILGVDTTEIMTYAEAAEEGWCTDRFYQYATNDAIWAYQLYKVFEPQLRRQELTKLFYNEEMQFQFVLRDLEINGVLVDKKKLQEQIDEAEPIRSKLYRELYDLGNVPYGMQYEMFEEQPTLISKVNLNNAQQCAKVIQDLGFEIIETTEGGQPSANKYALARLAGEHSFIDTLAKYRQYDYLLNNFLTKTPGRLDPDGRLRSSVNNCVTVTGRLSYSAPNLQNMPRKGTSPLEFREVIIPAPGYILVVADYAGQELRVLAHVAQDKNMIDAFLKGKDLHLSTANNFYKLGIAEELLITTHPEYESTVKQFKKERTNAKIINFGIAYGKTAIGFAADFGVSRSEAESIVDAYFKGCPAVKQAIDNCSKTIKTRGYVVNLAGRRRRFDTHQRHTGRARRQGFNFLIQGASADMIKIAMARVRKKLLEHPEWDAKLVLTVHDEMVIEGKEEYQYQIGELVKYEMEHAMKLSVPLVADITYGYSYGQAK